MIKTRFNKDREKFTEKDWGTTEEIFRNSICELYRLEIKAGGKSTFGGFHKHLYKYNLIYIEYGKLEIVREVASGQTKFIIGPDTDYTKFTVYPGTKHRFEALEETVAYEFYFVYCNPDDTIRYERNDSI